MIRTLVTLSAVSLCGCSREPGTPSGVTHTVDSAGVAVTTIGIAPDDVPQWTVDSVARRTLESPDSAGFVRVSAAHWLGDGRLLIADAQQLGVYIYDSAGVHLRTLGRKGRGPGEFERIMTVSVLHDTIGVWDLSLRRLSMFTADGGYIRLVPTSTPDNAYHTPREVWLVDGGVALTFWLRSDLPPPMPQGVRIRRWQSRSDLTITGTGGTITAQSPTFNGSYSGETATGDAGQVFSNKPFVAVTPGRVAYGSGEAFEVHLANGALQPRRIVRWPVTAEPLDPAEVVRARGALRQSLPPSAPKHMIEEALANLVAEELLPKTRPPLSRALFSDAGDVWLGRFEPPSRGLAESYDWVVLDSIGTPRGRVSLPEGTRLEAVRGDELLVSVRDSLDVQRVEVRRLNRR